MNLFLTYHHLVLFEYTFQPLDGGVLLVKEFTTDPSATRLYHISCDRLGSVEKVTGGDGEPVFEASYDEWGRQNVSTNKIGFIRGYTGHEMLPEFGLINMNGRMYDPLLARFLSPDDYVQMPMSPQGFNRYSYCMNNPMRYTDPSGELFGTIINFAKDLLVNTFGKVWSQGINAWTDGDNWHSTVMAYKIETGMFRGNALQILFHFTWEGVQTSWGLTSAIVQNTLYGVKSVSHYDGALAVETYSRDWGAFTLGNYIMGDRGLQANPYNTTFQHEYGHYLQSQSFGLFYIQRYGIPSLMDAAKKGVDHDYHAAEQDANIRALKYFHKHVDGFDVINNDNEKGWNLYENPINDYDRNLPYDNSVNKAARNYRKHLGWADFVFGPSLIFPGIINTIQLNQ